MKRKEEAERRRIVKQQLLIKSEIINANALVSLTNSPPKITQTTQKMRA